jgi:hypothetical protein
MTERMLTQLKATKTTATVKVSAVAQGADRAMGPALTSCESVQPDNVSFAAGMNHAVDIAWNLGINPDYVLVLNNDLEFPDPGWLEKLAKAARQDRITVPATDRTAGYVQHGPIAKAPSTVVEMSAYAWLIPFSWCKYLKVQHGFWLFCEDFKPGYGEDNWTVYLLLKRYGPRRFFQLVHRSFVKHLRHQTANLIVHDRKKTSALLISKFREEIKRKDLRKDLRAWAERYIRILKGC